MIKKTSSTLILSISLYLLMNYLVNNFFMISIFGIISFLLINLKYSFKNINHKSNQNYLKKFTLLVPAKNEEDRIGDSINYLKKIDYPKDYYQVIIINDNSTDNTLKILNNMDLPDNYKIFNRTRKDGFVAGVLNDGLNVISKDTEIVGIIDSDCVVSSNILTQVAERFQDNFKGAVQISEWHYNCTDNLLTMAQHLLCIYENYGIQSDPEFKVGHFYHQDLINSFKKYNEQSIIEDFELSYYLKKNKITIKTITDILIYRKFPKDIKKIYSQQYRYALGKQIIFYKNNFIQDEVILPIILFMILVTLNFRLFFVLIFIFYLILFNSWYLYYKISHKSALENCITQEIHNKILSQDSNHYFSLINSFSAIILGMFIILIRIFPFFKIPLGIEEIKWNRF